MKLGILGGTFNPIHLGHVIIAQAALEKFRLKQVIFIPTYQPYYKKAADLAPAHHRLKMVKLAVADNPLFRASDIEIKRKGPSYSINTVQKLKSFYPTSTKFYFIIGTDTLSELPLWHETSRLTRLCHFITVGRPGTDLLDIKRLKHSLGHSVATEFRKHYLVRPLIDISSSEIRSRIKNRKSIKYLVPQKVEKYIKRHRLYR